MPPVRLLSSASPGPCVLGVLGVPLSLAEAVDRALCQNAKTRQAWASVREQAANEGAALAAYLPTVTATLQGVRDESKTYVTDYPSLNSENRARVNSQTISVNWLLFDFGGRAAALASSQHLVAASTANQASTLQAVFESVATDYLSTQAAAAKLAADGEAQQIAENSLAVASERVKRGLAAITDELQAQTAYLQARLAVAKSDAEFRSSLGQLAVDMGMNPNSALEVPPAADTGEPTPDFHVAVETLIAEAESAHPDIAAAREQLYAAKAQADGVRSRALPTVSLIAKYSHNNQPVSFGLGEPLLPATGRDVYFGVQIQIPIFEGFGSSYQLRSARAREEHQQYVLDQTTLQVGLDVWKSYHTLLADTQNFSTALALHTVAKSAFQAAKRRYVVGVGSILELLNAQTALSEASKARVAASIGWRSSRLHLAAKIGRLDATTLSGLDDR
ncbi:Fis family transcriptional regulator (plasmid) [Ralstonia solanacearum]|nr:Fis family transcriptional regulator [Ralstonia solanacearum]